MHFKKKTIALAIMGTLIVAGCSNTEDTDGAGSAAASDMRSSVAKVNLTDPAVLAKASNTNTVHTVEGDSLKVVFEAISEDEASSKWPNVKFHPVDGSWDWLSKGGLKLKLENPGTEQVRIEVKLADSVGTMGSATHQFDLPVYLEAGETRVVDVFFNGTKMKMDGYRGGSEINLKTVAEMQLYAVGPIAEQTVIIHDIDFIEGTGDFVTSEARTDEIIAATIPTALLISDFDDGYMDVVDYNVGTSIKKVKTDSGKGIQVHYGIEEAYPTISFGLGQSEGKAWDWSEYGDVVLAVDIENQGEDGAQLFVRVDDDVDEKFGGKATGAVHSRSGYVQVAGNSKSTYYFTLRELAESMNSGMRGEPPKKSFSATQVNFGWGESELDLSNIVSFQLYMQSPQAEATFIYDNLRLIPNLSADTGRYVDLIDQFGQYIEDEWEEKVNSLKDLQERGVADLTLAKNAKPMADRSKFGGWKNGPQLEATGNFRTEKVGDKWALVDPEGYLYFVTGLDNIRLDDTYTITGVGFTEVGEVNTEDLRPSQVSENPYTESTEERDVLSSLRRQMFTWLPEYSDKLASNYQYTMMVHTGALDHGEVFSFYGANLQRKYDTDTHQETLDIWKDVTLARMQDWGFTSLGNWSDSNIYYENGKVPYTAHGWIVGKHQRISTGNDYWFPMHDPFDPEFRVSVATMGKQVAADVNNDPFCIGYFVENELSWGNEEANANHYALATSALRSKASDSSAKAAFDKLLQDKYGSIDKLNAAWGVEVVSWDAFANGFDTKGKFTDAIKEDLSAMLSALSEQYFRVVDEEMSALMPDHLNMGSRFSHWGTISEATDAAAKYVDVMSYNLYATGLTKKDEHWMGFDRIDLPSIIGEFHFGSLDSGLFHPGLLSTDDQAGRATSYGNYMQTIVEHPNFIGAHWFQYMDSPATGRAWDGENYNVGFVTVTDTPYEMLVDEAKKFNKALYETRYGDLK